MKWIQLFEIEMQDDFILYHRFRVKYMISKSSYGFHVTYFISCIRSAGAQKA